MLHPLKHSRSLHHTQSHVTNNVMNVYCPDHHFIYQIPLPRLKRRYHLFSHGCRQKRTSASKSGVLPPVSAPLSNEDPSLWEWAMPGLTESMSYFLGTGAGNEPAEECKERGGCIARTNEHDLGNLTELECRRDCRKYCLEKIFCESKCASLNCYK